MNKYQYTFNNPLRYIDPSGHQAQDDWWSRLTRYIFGSKTQVVIDEDRTKEQQEPKLLGLDEEKMIEKHREVLIKTNEVIGDVIEFLDPTGATTVIKEHMKGNADGVVIAIVGMTLGGKSSVTFGEAKKLVGAWAKDPVEKTISASIKYHYGTHGAETGAQSVWQYLRKAESFAQNLKNATKTILEDGKIRYSKNGKYIILDSERKIVSYGNIR